MRSVALTYHGVDDVGGRIALEDDPERLLTSPEHLAAHIRLLRRTGHRFVTATDVIGDEAPAGRLALLTFDDGFANWIDAALPVLERERVPATFYVCPGWYGAQHPDVAGRAGRLMGEADVRRLVDAGMQVGSHALTHPDLRGLADPELDRQLTESKNGIETVTGDSCRTLAYPFGLYDPRVQAAASAAGYELSWGWVPGAWMRHAAPRLAAPPRHGGRRLMLKMLGIRRFWAP